MGPERLTFRLDPDPDLAAAARIEGRAGTVEAVDLPGHRPAQRYVPADLTGPVPLVVMFHGAGGRPEQSVALLRPFADRHGFAVLAPGSRAATWDRVLGSFGPDVRATDAVLRRFSERTPVIRVALAGFSDGASYALSLGLSNGDLVEAVMAFSPGFAAPARRRGGPAVFVSHGVDDRVLPIDRCSLRLVPALRDQGYAVTYREFAGGHEVPAAVGDEASRWLSGRP